MEEKPGVIRGVIFDFGNVICSFDVGRFLARLQRWSGLPVETLREKVYGSGLHSRFERGDVSPGEFHRLVESMTGAGVPAEEFARGFVDIFAPIESTRALIRGLKGKVRLGLLSNTNELHFRRHIRNEPVFPLFDTVTLSYEIGALKPEPAIYRDALGKLSLPPEECVFIDDIEAYAEGAKAVGIRGIRFTGGEKLLSDLAGLGVVPL
ncbi:MAG: HAD family phosphatase [Deltaproteobacteria bacterium]|nr:HAD family phosphatase [Deltaproteobacteria bacterium]